MMLKLKVYLQKGENRFWSVLFRPIKYRQLQVCSCYRLCVCDRRVRCQLNLPLGGHSRTENSRCLIN